MIYAINCFFGFESNLWFIILFLNLECTEGMVCANGEPPIQEYGYYIAESDNEGTIP